MCAASMPKNCRQRSCMEFRHSFNFCRSTSMTTPPCMASRVRRASVNEYHVVQAQKLPANDTVTMCFAYRRNRYRARATPVSPSPPYRTRSDAPRTGVHDDSYRVLPARAAASIVIIFLCL